MNWKESFHYESSGPYHPYSIWYHHWLPDNNEELLPSPLTDDGEVPDYYEEFDTLIHVTTFENAAKILKYGFKPKCVSDSSVVNKEHRLYDPDRKLDWESLNLGRDHPIENKEVIWYGPTTFKKVKDIASPVERYGNVVFAMKTLEGYEGLLRGTAAGYDPYNGLNLYFIEVLEYKTQSACRILVTTKTYPTLRKFDPFTKGGPFYCDLQNNRFYHLKSIKRQNGELIENLNAVEFMKEPTEYDFVDDYQNHVISFSDCNLPRNRVRVDDLENEMDVLKMILKWGLIIWSMPTNNAEKLKILSPFEDERTTKEKLKASLAEVQREAISKSPQFDLNTYINDFVKPTTIIGQQLVPFYRKMLRAIPIDERTQVKNIIWGKIKYHIALEINGDFKDLYTEQ